MRIYLNSQQCCGMISFGLTCVVASAIILASAGGIGGGGLVAPILQLYGGMNASVAIPLSKAVMCGNAIGNVGLNWRKRHPWADRPSISFPTALLLEPPTLIGGFVGVVINRTLLSPKWTLLLTVVILLVVVVQTFIQVAVLVLARFHSVGRVQIVFQAT